MFSACVIDIILNGSKCFMYVDHSLYIHSCPKEDYCTSCMRASEIFNREVLNRYIGVRNFDTAGEPYLHLDELRSELIKHRQTNQSLSVETASISGSLRLNRSVLDGSIQCVHLKFSSAHTELDKISSMRKTLLQSKARIDSLRAHLLGLITDKRLTHENQSQKLAAWKLSLMEMRDEREQVVFRANHSRSRLAESNQRIISLNAVLENVRESSDKLLILRLKCMERFRCSVLTHSEEAEKLKLHQTLGERMKLQIHEIQTRLREQLHRYSEVHQKQLRATADLKQIRASVKALGSPTSRLYHSDEAVAADRDRCMEHSRVNDGSISSMDRERCDPLTFALQGVDIVSRHSFMKEKLKDVQQMRQMGKSLGCAPTKMFYLSPGVHESEVLSKLLINDELKKCQSAEYPIEPFLVLIRTLLYYLHHAATEAVSDRAETPIEPLSHVTPPVRF